MQLLLTWLTYIISCSTAVDSPRTERESLPISTYGFLYINHHLQHAQLDVIIIIIIIIITIEPQQGNVTQIKANNRPHSCPCPSVSLSLYPLSPDLYFHLLLSSMCVCVFLCLAVAMSACDTFDDFVLTFDCRSGYFLVSVSFEFHCSNSA